MRTHHHGRCISTRVFAFHEPGFDGGIVGDQVSDRTDTKRHTAAHTSDGGMSSTAPRERCNIKEAKPSLTTITSQDTRIEIHGRDVVFVRLRD